MYSISKIIDALHRLRWTAYNIGFIEKSVDTVNDLDITGEKIHWMDTRGYNGGWMADPFIYDADEQSIIVLAEEMHQGLGRLVRLTVGRSDYKLRSVDVVLQLDTHLSFPNFIRHTDGKVYIYPENYQGGALNLYPYDDATCCVGTPIRIVEAPLIDSQIAKIDDLYYVFGVMCPKGGKCDNRMLYIYSSPSLFGPYTLCQQIANDFAQERGAGAIFSCEGRWIRPVQKCDESYGEATIIKELTMDNGEFSEKVLCTITPEKSSRWGLALHTYNKYGNLIVIDGLGYLYPRINKLLRLLNI